MLMLQILLRVPDVVARYSPESLRATLPKVTNGCRGLRLHPFLTDRFSLKLCWSSTSIFRGSSIWQLVSLKPLKRHSGPVHHAALVTEILREELVVSKAGLMRLCTQILACLAQLCGGASDEV